MVTCANTESAQTIHVGFVLSLSCFKTKSENQKAGLVFLIKKKTHQEKQYKPELQTSKKKERHFLFWKKKSLRRLS